MSFLPAAPAPLRRRPPLGAASPGCAYAAIVRCALESARAFFRDRAGPYVHRAGRTLDDGELSPACMADAFRYLGKAARAALCAIARHLRLLYLAPIGCLRSSMAEADRGFVMLLASDHPGSEVCDPNGHWYLADGGSCPSDLLLLIGRALSHVTAGLRPTSQCRTTNENRASLTFRQMPHANAVLDCSPISAAGHGIPHIYQPISAGQFMDDLCAAEEHAISNHLEASSYSQGNFVCEPSLRSVLSDPCLGPSLKMPWFSHVGTLLVVSC